MKGVIAIEPKVSIIMGVFNAEKTISRAIDSLLMQTYKNIEIIVCDDCSTDRTYAILKRYETNNKNIILIKNKENKKLAYSLNECLNLCDNKSKYIARMDADDICINDRIEKQVTFLENNLEYSVVGTARYIDNGFGEMKITNIEKIPNKKSMLKGSPFAHPTIMIKKKCLDKLNGYTVSDRTIRGQDLDLWFRFFSMGYKGYNLEEPLIVYHETIEDYKKRTLKTAFMYFRTNLFGYKLLNFPFHYYIYAFKPLISAILPSKLMFIFHNKGTKK